MIPRTIALSYSRMRDYETCPAMFEAAHIKRMKTKPNTAMLRGSDIHKKIENYVRTGRQAYLDGVPRGENVAGLIATMANAGYMIAPEKQIPMSSTWRILSGPFDKDIWMRVAIDLYAADQHDAVVVDWKTGTPRPDPFQLDIYALSAFKLQPSLRSVTTMYGWLDVDREPDVFAYTPGIVRDIEDKINGIADSVELSKQKDQWDTKPGRHCMWCVKKEMCPDASR